MVNKRYYFLDDTVQVYKDLLVNSMSELGAIYAEKYNVPKDSVTAALGYVVRTKFTKEMRAAIKKLRIFHKNKRRTASV